MNSYSIRQDGVYTGRWTDESNGARVLTLTIGHAVVLAAATAFFVTVVFSCIWSLQKFFMHHYLAGIERTDGLGLQYRVWLRNPGSALDMVVGLLMMGFAWMKSRTKADRCKRRILGLILFALLNMAGAAVASILSSKIGGKGYESTDILLNPRNCGILQPNLSVNDTEYWQLSRFMIQTAFNDTQAARQYAHSCYQGAPDSGQCSFFASSSVPFSTAVVDCPFGSTPAGNNICQPNAGKAFQLMTASLDVGKIFGVNVPPKNQIEVRKGLTCAPIQTSEYIRTENATTYLDLGPVPGVSDYTIMYKPQARQDNVGYQVFSLTTGGGGIWSPTEALVNTLGDVSITVLAGNSVHYLEPVEDPWFSAHQYDSFTKSYLTDNDLSVIACIDQYQICNPAVAGNASTCTILGTFEQVFTASTEIGLNKYQLVLAKRMLSVFFQKTNIWQVIDAQGAGSLLASSNVIAMTSNGLPDNQWELEVRDWFTTSLANMQAGVVQYVNNLDPATLGKYAFVANFIPSLTGVPEDYLCRAQRVRNTGGYVNFSLPWLVSLLCVGVAIMPLSVFIGPAQGWFKKNPSRHDVVRTADLTLQILRTALNAPQGESDSSDSRWARRMEDIPVPTGGSMFLLPRLRTDDEGGHKDYWPTRFETEKNANVNLPPVAAEEDQEVDTPVKTNWLPVVTISEELEAQSLMDEALSTSRSHDNRRHGGSTKSIQSSVSNLTD